MEMGNNGAKETAGGVVFFLKNYAVSAKKHNYLLGVSLIHKQEMVKKFFDLSQVCTKSYLWISHLSC